MSPFITRKVSSRSVDLRERARRAERLALLVVRDRDAVRRAVPEDRLDQVRQVAHRDHQVGEVVRGQLPDDHVEDRPVADRHQRLRQHGRVRREPRSLTAGEDHASLARLRCHGDPLRHDIACLRHDRPAPDPPVRRPARRRGGRRGRRHAALGLAHAGPAHGGIRGRLRRPSRRAARGGALELHRGAAPRLPGRRGRPRRRGHRAGITFVATANAARYCGATPVLADIAGPHDLGIDPDDVERR